MFNQTPALSRSTPVAEAKYVFAKKVFFFFYEPKLLNNFPQVKPQILVFSPQKLGRSGGCQTHGWRRQSKLFPALSPCINSFTINPTPHSPPWQLFSHLPGSTSSPSPLPGNAVGRASCAWLGGGDEGHHRAYTFVKPGLVHISNFQSHKMILEIMVVS